MAIISDRDRQTIREHLEANLTGQVEIIFFTERPSPIIIPGRQECFTCEDTRQILEEVAGLSDKIRLTMHDLRQEGELASEHGIDRVPAFLLKGAARGRLRFFGMPSGYEFSTLIADLVDVSRGTTGLSEETLQYLASLNQDVNIKVFVTPT
jgi:alkyl hydroperoxide reductase subunit AhpF